MANNIDIVLIPQDKISAVYPMIIRDMQKILAKAKNGYNEKHMMQELLSGCLLYTSPSPRDAESSRMPSSA